ncbi:NADAR family protein [Allobaculum mucilyticum]|uniref:NADAR family protein n=1 Tax=Allobaculum mucilyticum TaxID=2834459 RepID=UPI001E3FCC8D|nr:NADAR family protein [Allobaculum mucilyticum]UNT96093.1 NADAR family protein [Allobaculum mucilyticum]
MNEITRFRDEYFFLSNMYPVPIEFEGVKYLCSESAYQASKCIDPKDREQFVSLDGYEAKKLSREIPWRSDWFDINLDVMCACLKDKFTRHPQLAEQLLATGDAKLIEGNTWDDQFWGVCDGVGENHLGKLLMQVRSELKEEKKNTSSNQQEI